MGRKAVKTKMDLEAKEDMKVRLSIKIVRGNEEYVCVSVYVCV